LFVKTELQGDAKVFGLLIGMIGLGAVFGAILLSRVKSRLTPERLVALSSLLLFGVFIVIALVQIEIIVMLVCVIFGACWLWILSTFNVSAQLALPDWVRPWTGYLLDGYLWLYELRKYIVGAYSERISYYI
jgi:predicted MFS family arabinose efflux permease